MTGFEIKIAEVLSEVFEDAPDEQLLFAAGELVRCSGELWLDVRQRPPMIGDRVLGLGAKGIVHCGTVFSDPGRDGRIALRAEGHMVFVRDWMPCPEGKGGDLMREYEVSRHGQVLMHGPLECRYPPPSWSCRCWRPGMRSG